MPDGFADRMTADVEFCAQLFFGRQQTANRKLLRVYALGELMRDLHIQGLADGTTFNHTISEAVTAR